MKLVLLALSLAAIAAGASTASGQSTGLKGDWTGVLAQQLRLILHIGETATLTSVDQGGQAIEGILTEAGGKVTFAIPARGMSFEAALSADGQQLAGTFKQGATALPLTLTKAASGAELPTAAVRTLPLRQDREVSIDGGRAPLYGSLTIPDQARPGPAVLFIAGSGPTDRDSNSTIPGNLPDTFKLMAAALAERGIASLRFDKRGIAKSTPAATSEADVRFTNYVDDAAAWARYLAAQPNVTCVVILGHSEGALIAPMAAQKAPVCGVISVSGIGRPFDQVLMEQLRAQALPAASIEHAETILAGLKQGHTFPNEAATDPLFRPSIQPYLISQVNIDPPAALAGVKAPVLIVQGDNDIQVTLADARRLATARPEARVVIVPGMNHVLKLAPTDRAGNSATYADPTRPLAPGLMEAITTFVMGLSPR